MNCTWCDEPLDDKSGVSVFSAMHRECMFRAVAGSVAHIEGRCGCYVPGSDETDDPALTKHQAAIASMEAWNKLQRLTAWPRRRN
jgi:hypothetical protein